MKTAQAPHTHTIAARLRPLLLVFTCSALLMACSSTPGSSAGGADLGTRAPFQWPDLRQHEQVRLFVADLLEAPGDAQLDTAVVQIRRVNERVFQVEYRFRHPLQSEGPHAVDPERLSQVHQCIAARLAHGLGGSHWGVAPGFDDVAFSGDRAVRQLALVLQADHQPYRHLLPQDLRNSVTGRDPAEVRAACQTLTRPEFMTW